MIRAEGSPIAGIYNGLILSLPVWALIALVLA